MLYWRVTRPDFGDAQIDVLADHFSPVLSSPEHIPDEWTLLKARLYLEPQLLTTLTWEDVNRLHRDTCPNVLELIDLILTIPASTADCERGFNIMKVVKSDWRSSLKADTLSDLLLMQLSSPPISEFDPSAAVELWHTDCIRGRRPNFKDCSKQVADTDSDMSDSEADDVVIT
ncbi:zinc finger protein 862-like isoform X2 [Epinephelus moara]|uniref:zinc finger protein 862-like isoform X2 n=1 Tax=Epinephelus moara TaxID=300413 RepID=UPI00214F5A89|nr:zinc finger protein 862-like isoform X2 [Epinephelus moara]